MEYIFPAAQADGFEALFEFFDHLVAGRVPDEDVGTARFVAEGDDFGGACHLPELFEHIVAGGCGGIDAQDLFSLVTVESLEICAAAVCPGMAHEFFVEGIDIFRQINDLEIDYVLCDRGVCPDIIAVGGDALLSV